MSIQTIRSQIISLKEQKNHCKFFVNYMSQLGDFEVIKPEYDKIRKIAKLSHQKIIETPILSQSKEVVSLWNELAADIRVMDRSMCWEAVKSTGKSIFKTLLIVSAIATPIIAIGKVISNSKRVSRSRELIDSSVPDASTLTVKTSGVGLGHPVHIDGPQMRLEVEEASKEDLEKEWEQFRAKQAQEKQNDIDNKEEQITLPREYNGECLEDPLMDTTNEVGCTIS